MTLTDYLLDMAELLGDIAIGTAKYGTKLASTGTQFGLKSASIPLAIYNTTVVEGNTIKDGLGQVFDLESYIHAYNIGFNAYDKATVMYDKDAGLIASAMTFASEIGNLEVMPAITNVFVNPYSSTTAGLTTLGIGFLGAYGLKIITIKDRDTIADKTRKGLVGKIKRGFGKNPAQFKSERKVKTDH